MTQIDNHLHEQQVMSREHMTRLRYAPSPTGFQHIGGFRTALFSWLYARHCGGQFILRIEDTDVARTLEGSVDNLIEGLHWLGMDIDEGPRVGGPYGPYYQTQRKALYQQYAHQLIASGHAYRCYCTPERLDEMRKQQEAQRLPPRYDRHCRYLSDEERAANEAAGLKWVVRFAMPLEGETVVHDGIHGDIVFKNSDIDRFCLAWATSCEVEESKGGEDLEEAGGMRQIAGFDQAPGGFIDLKVEPGEVFVGNLCAVNLDAFVDADQVGRGVEAGAVACGDEDAGQSGSRRALAVGSSDQNGGKGGLRIAERSGQNTHVGQVELAAGGAGGGRGELVAQGVKMVDRSSVRHGVILGDGACLVTDRYRSGTGNGPA